MKRGLMTLLVFLLGSQGAVAQVLIESPVSATVMRTDSVIDNGTSTVPKNSGTQVTTSVANVVRWSATVPGTAGNTIQYATGNGVFEFDLATFSLPQSITADNFTARLKSISASATDGVDLAVDLFDLTDEQEDGAITPGDFDAVLGQAVNETPMVRGAFPEDGVDVTALVRRDLFGDGQGDSSIGFVLRPVEGAGIVHYYLDNALIEINRLPVDTATTGSDTGSVDTDTLSVGSDTGSVDTGDKPGTVSDSDLDSDSSVDDGQISDPDVSCSCRAAGESQSAGLLSLLLF